MLSLAGLQEHVVGHVQGMRCPWDIVVCHQDHQLYVAKCFVIIRLYYINMYSLLDTNTDIQGMTDAHDMVVCHQDRQLYVAKYDCIQQMSDGDHKSVKWLTIDSTDRFNIWSPSLTSRRHGVSTTLLTDG